MDNLQKATSQFKTELKGTTTLSELDNLQIKYLGRKGLINDLLQSINILKQDEKKEFGKKLNMLKTSINQLIEVKKQELLKNIDNNVFIDITLPGKQYPRGSLHPITTAIEEISSIFQKIGFIRMTYPEVEWEYFSFDALNMPKNHPARDDFESLFIDSPKKEK